MRKNYVKKEPKFKEIKRSLDAFYTFAIKIYKYVTRVKTFYFNQKHSIYSFKYSRF